MSLFGFISREESERKLTQKQQENDRNLALVRQENASQLAQIQQENDRKLAQVQQENASQLAQIQQENDRKLAQVQQENKRKLAKIGERLKKLSLSFENVLCKLCESPLSIEVWKFINKQLSKEDAQDIVCSISKIFLYFELES